MTSYTNPAIVPIPYAVGSDAIIEQMRIKLGDLPWLEKIFGRAIVQHTAGDGGADVVYPEVWGPANEPMNVMMNDNLRAYCFFLGRDPETIMPYDPFSSQMFLRRPISVILWADLVKVDSTKKYKYSDFLKLELFNLLSRIPTFTLQTAFESYSKVFEGFTITETYKKYLKPPFWAIRIDGIINYHSSCENSEGGLIAYLLNDDGTPLLGDDGQPLLAD